jgi:TRAP-type uncharacterized transport system substrate-binding protein
VLRALILSLVVATATVAASPAQDGRRGSQVKIAPEPAASAEASIRNRTNAWSVGFAAGLLEGAPIRFATELARIVNDGGEMHVLPIVTRGPTENVNDLLYLRGVDIAIINGDSLDEYRAQVPQIGQRIVQIMNLFPSELHVFVRPDISSLAELAGKKVNFNTQGTAAAYSGPLIFTRLGVDVEKMFVPHPVALEQLRRGEIAAVVFVTSKPVDAFTKGKWEKGYKFLPVEFGPSLSDYYLPARLDHSDYPALIESGQTIPTISVPTVLVSYNWRPGTARYDRVARFVRDLFSRFDRLRSPGFDPKWKDVDLATKAPGLDRFRPAQEWLDSKVAARSEHP